MFQRYRCKNCDCTYNDITGTIFEHSTIALRKWFPSVYAYIRFNNSLWQLDIDVSYKTVYRRVQRFLRVLDAPRPLLEGPVELDELYVKAGLRGRERDQESRSRRLSTHGRGKYAEDKPSVFVLVDRGTNNVYMLPDKSAEESNVRLLLGDHEKESLTVYTAGFRGYDPLEDDDEFDREYIVHCDGEYVDGEVHVNTCESHASLTRRWLSPHRGVSKDKLTPYVRAF